MCRSSISIASFGRVSDLTNGKWCLVTFIASSSQSFTCTSARGMLTLFKLSKKAPIPLNITTTLAPDLAGSLKSRLRSSNPDWRDWALATNALRNRQNLSERVRALRWSDEVMYFFAARAPVKECLSSLVDAPIPFDSVSAVPIHVLYAKRSAGAVCDLNAVVLACKTLFHVFWHCDCSWSSWCSCASIVFVAFSTLASASLRSPPRGGRLRGAGTRAI